MPRAIAGILTDFNVVVLAFLHVNSDGSLMHNNDPISPDSNPEMADGFGRSGIRRDPDVVDGRHERGQRFPELLQQLPDGVRQSHGRHGVLQPFGLDFDLESSSSAQDLCL